MCWTRSPDSAAGVGEEETLEGEGIVDCLPCNAWQSRRGDDRAQIRKKLAPRRPTPVLRPKSVASSPRGSHAIPSPSPLSAPSPSLPPVSCRTRNRRGLIEARRTERESGRRTRCVESH